MIAPWLAAVAWLAPLACAPPACLDGFKERTDGVCTRTTTRPFEGDATVQDLVNALPACVPAAPGAGLDTRRHCADGACVGATAAEISEALGESPTCAPYLEPQYQETYADCTWPSGVSETFEDFDADGVPDAGAVANLLVLEAPYAGRTADGLGLDAGLRCFVDAWGNPTGATLVHDGVSWVLASLAWSDVGASVGQDSAEGPIDGTPSWLSLYESY